MRKLLLLGWLGLAIAACGDEKNSGLEQVSPADQSEISGTWYGYAKGLLRSAEEKEGTVTYQIECSPVFKESSLPELKMQVENWMSVNFEPMVMIKNAVNFEGCWVEANQPRGRYSSSELSLDPKDCTAQPLTLYGMIRC
jgi:hypothetical protein